MANDDSAQLLANLLSGLTNLLRVQAESGPSLPALNSSSSTSGFNFQNVQSIGNMIPVKLTKDNYMLWKELFIPVLEHYDMLDIVDRTVPFPPRFIAGMLPTDPPSPNPEFLDWNHKDKTLKIWIQSSLSESVLPYVVGAKSARDLWLNLPSCNHYSINENSFSSKFSILLLLFLSKISSVFISLL